MSREMKDSGIAWIGEIPKGWKVGKVKHFYQFITGFTPDTKKDYYYDENGIPWVTISDLSGKFIEETKMGISQKYIELNNPIIVPQNSLLYSFKLSVGQVARTKFELYTNEAIASFLHNDNISLDYLYYSSQICIIQNANENIYGAKLLNQNLISNAIIIFPPLPEQQKIAEFLDRKCGEIDELVALQEKMIEELKAYKQSVITEAVTKGLNPNAPMKDSGIEWIGEIPKGWIRAKYRYSGVFTKGKLPNEQNIECLGKPIIGASEMLGKECRNFSLDTNVPTCQKQDVLILWDGANAGIVANNCDGIVSSTVVKYECTDENFDSQFLFYLFKNGEHFFKSKVNGTTIPHMNQKYIDEYLCIQPPLPEQQAIADYLDKKCAEIDELVAVKQQKIETLKEYKKSLIYEYVTGKKEVI